VTRIVTLEDFASAVPAGALIGLDPGTKTIGVAVSDERRTLASPLETVRRTRLTDDLVKLRDILDARQAVGLVVGMPLNMNGSAGPRAQSVRAFARSLEEAFGLPVLQWDERLSSYTADEAMKDAGVRRDKRAARIDSAAASIILQGALDRLATTGGE
jgi:putative Holliday junction resolvase